MFIKQKHMILPVSLDSGRKPSADGLSDGTYLNVRDKKVYTIENGIESESIISEEEILSLAELDNSIYGLLIIKDMPQFKNTFFVEMAGIGSLFGPGDEIILPFGKVSQVKEILNVNVVSCTGSMGSRTIENGFVRKLISKDVVLSGKVPLIKYKPKRLVVIGASIMGSIFGGSFTPTHSTYADKFDIDTVLGNANGGKRFATIINNITDAVASDTNETFYMIHIGGNDVSGTRMFDTMPVETLERLQNEFRAVLEALAPLRGRFLISNISFRSYVDPELGRDIFDNEEKGSKPYNDNIIEPMLRSYYPECFNENGFIFDLYNLTRNDFRSILGSDGIHLSGLGKSIYSDYMASILKSLRTGEVINIPRLDNPKEKIYEDILPEYKDAYVLNFSDKIHSFANSYTMTDVPDGTPIALHNNSGISEGVAVEITTTATQWTTSGINKNALGASTTEPVFDGTIYSADITTENLFTISDQEIYFKLTGLKPNTIYLVDAVGSRLTDSTRTTTVSDGTNSISFETSSGNIIRLPSVEMTSDNDGNISLTMTVSYGTYGYIAGIGFREKK